MTTLHATNEKGNGCDPVPFKKHTTNEANYPIDPLAGKASANLKALFARSGHLVHEGGNEDYFVVKTDWRMSRYCCNLAALIAFARQLGVIHHG